MSESRVRVLIVDDDPLVCEGLRLMLSPFADLEVVAAVHAGEEVVAAVHAHRPDVILMDVRMHAQDGIETTRQVTAMTGRVPKVLILTTFDLGELPLRAVLAGAAGFLLKTAPPAEIVHAVREAAAGRSPISTASATHIVAHLRGDHRIGAALEAIERVRALTERERAVVALVAHGHGNRRIGELLHLGEATVKTHLASAQAKLGVTSRPEVAVIADRAGLLA